MYITKSELIAKAAKDAKFTRVAAGKAIDVIDGITRFRSWFNMKERDDYH